MPPSLILQTLSSSNTLNYIQPTPNQHIPHALSKKSSILKNGDNPYINQYSSQSTSAQPIRISILHIHTGITNMHGLMPFFYKTQIIAILGSFIFITPWNLQISLFGSSNGEIILVVIDFLKDHPLVENEYLHFKQNFQPSPSKRKFSSLFIFCTKFFVP